MTQGPPPPADARARDRIVAYDDGHLQVIACAGAGKTETMALRVARLLTVDRVAPASVLAFTFTNAAADALKARILRKVAEQDPAMPLDRLSPMFVGTIHGWCLRFLQERVPRYATYDLFEEHRLVGLVTREYWDIGIQDLSADTNMTRNAQRFLATVSVVQNELLAADELPAGPFRRCYERFLDLLERYRVLTHDRCIAAAVEALRDPATAGAAREALRHVVVDEFQDVNPAQAQLVALLGAAPVHVCVVGDDDQAIYQWRGSSVEYIQRFAVSFGAHTETLARNRRSVANVVERAAAFAERIPGHMEKRFEAHRDARPGAVQIFVAPTAADEADRVADAVARLREGGVALRDIAILLRSVRTSAGPFVAALQARGIAYACAGRNGLFLEPEAEALGFAYGWLAGRAALWDPRNRQPVPCDLHAAVDRLLASFELPRAAQPALAAWLRAWAAEARAARESDLVSRYYALLRELGVARWDPDDPRRAVRLGTLARFSQLLVDFEAVTRRARRLRDTGELRGGLAGGERYLDRLGRYLAFYAQGEYEGFEGEPGYGADAVTVSTVHAAKGLEWPVVFVPAMSAARFPSSKNGTHRDWLIPRSRFPAARYEGCDADERRLFYVAMTRARDLLVVTTHDRVATRVTGRSPYFVEIGGGQVQPSSARIPLPAWTPEPATSPADTPTFSFSELASYLGCPKAYRYRESFGFAPPAAKELGYGKSVHHVLRRIADSTRETARVPGPPELERILDAEFYLPYADRPSQQVMRDHAKRLVEAYVDHFHDDLLRIWEVERSFELHLSAANVSGRADVILDHHDGRAGALALVDYKTRPDSADDPVTELQLRTYATAARGEGLDVRAAYVHQLGVPAHSARTAVSIATRDTDAAIARVEEATQGIRARRFEACPGHACDRCDVRPVCSQGAAPTNA
jgi:DNA helicase-2/ATP-dependent DNA helicase PcrA